MNLTSSSFAYPKHVHNHISSYLRWQVMCQLPALGMSKNNIDRYVTYRVAGRPKQK